MRIFIVTKTAWDLPIIIIHQVVCDLISAGTLQSSSEIMVVSDGFDGVIPPGATIISSAEAEKLLVTSADAAIVHFGVGLKGGEHLPNYFIDLTAPKHLVDGLIANGLALLAHKKTVKKARSVFGWLDLPAPSLPSFEWSDLALARSRNTSGDNYFMAFVAVSEIVSTLKEFSVFKKWQQTSMAIVFVCKDQKELTKATALVKGYKYRNAVFFKLVNALQLIDFAAAYCTLWSSPLYYYPRLMQWSAGLGVPLLINSSANWPIAYTKAGECFDFPVSMGLSNHFKLYYKDEVYKQSKANHGHAWFNQMIADGLTIKNGIFAP